jgi:hypothetical protein
MGERNLAHIISPAGRWRKHYHHDWPYSQTALCAGGSLGGLRVFGHGPLPTRITDRSRLIVIYLRGQRLPRRSVPFRGEVFDTRHMLFS